MSLLDIPNGPDSVLPKKAMIIKENDVGIQDELQCIRPKHPTTAKEETDECSRRWLLERARKRKANKTTLKVPAKDERKFSKLNLNFLPYLD